MSITVIATLHAEPGRREELLEALSAHVPEIRAEAGCLSYVPHTAGRDRLVILESWANPEALKAHAEGPALASVNAAIETLLKEPMDVVVARPVGEVA